MIGAIGKDAPTPRDAAGITVIGRASSRS